MRALFLALAVLSACATAPNPNPTSAGPPTPETADAAAIDAYVSAQVQGHAFIGLSVAVVQDGKVVLAKGYGKSSLATGEPVTAETPFAIGSVTKQFTAACIFLLAEDGKLSVDDPVAKYFPALSRAGDVTLYDLMTHTSGYPDFYPLDFIDRRIRKPITPDELIRQYATGKLDFDPGTRWSYSNTGYIILGRVVEKASGEPFARFLGRRILEPLGMAHTLFNPPPGDRQVAAGYTSFALGEAEPAEREANDWAWSAGALYSTAADLAKWDLALAEGRVLSPASYARMTTPRKLADGRTRDYGCGVGVHRRHNETVVEHGGAVSGFLAANAMIPRTRSAVIVLSNADHSDPGALGDRLVSLLLKQPEHVPHVGGPGPKEVALALLRQMQAGRMDRTQLAEEFSLYLSDEQLRRAAPRLAALGEPESTTVESIAERGGMEVAWIRFAFKSAAARALLYRTPDGKVAEFLLLRP